MSAVADVESDLWDRLCEIDRNWTEKKPLRQTAFTSFVTLTRLEKLKLLKTWEEEGFSSYMNQLKRVVAEKRNGKEETPTIQENLQNQNRGLKDKVAELEEENHSIKEQLIEKDRLIAELKEKLENTSFSAEDEQGCNKNFTQECKTVGRTGQCRPGKRKFQEELEQIPATDVEREESSFKEGQKVWAYYLPLKTYYPAKILQCSSQTNKYKVKFVEDNIVKVLKEDDVRHFEEK